MLPEGEDLNEWVAVNTVDFFNQVRLAQWRPIVLLEFSSELKRNCVSSFSGCDLNLFYSQEKGNVGLVEFESFT
jgi:hypothetical protein